MLMLGEKMRQSGAESTSSQLAEEQSVKECTGHTSFLVSMIANCSAVGEWQDEFPHQLFPRTSVVSVLLHVDKFASIQHHDGLDFPVICCCLIEFTQLEADLPVLQGALCFYGDCVLFTGHDCGRLAILACLVAKPTLRDFIWSLKFLLSTNFQVLNVRCPCCVEAGLAWERERENVQGLWDPAFF